MWRLRNRLLPLPRACHILSTSTSTTLPSSFSLEDYLVAACGLAPAQALEVSKKAAHQLSTEYRKQDASFYGSFDRALKAAKRNRGLLSSSLERVIKPNIALFRQRGVLDVGKVCFNNPRVLTFKPEHVKELLLRAEELGVPAASPMFRHAVAIVTSVSRERAAAKVEFFKRTLGCSQSEVSIAVSKMPQILGLSDAILLRKIEFLVNVAAMEPQYIVQRPILLAFSLEKRLVPRHHVMKVLQEKGLLNSNMNLFSLVALTEETFKSKFLDSHKDSVPGLEDAYAAACASIVPSRV